MSTTPNSKSALTIPKGDIIATDWLQLYRESDGSILGWIDQNGIPQGTLALSSGQSVELKTNGVPNATQTTLNLIPGANVTMSSDGAGGVTVAASGNSSAAAIRYVASTGNDSNDGLSWVTAKLTVHGALLALPGGSTSPDTAGQGTVYVANGSAAHPTATCGIWLMGATDPNYASPPTGWLKSTGLLQIIGIGGLASSQGFNEPRCFLTGGGSVDINHPGIWVSGLNAPTVFANLMCQNKGRAVVVGEDSNHGRSGSGTGGCSAITFRNVGGSVAGTAGLGPCWDIVGGSFWLRFFGCYGSGIDFLNTPTANNAAAFLFDGTGNNGIGYQYLEYISIVSGCIKINPGTVNPAGQTMSIRHVESESQVGPAGVYITGSVFPNDVLIEGVHLSDSANIPCVINLGTGNVLISDLVGPNKNNLVQGPATILYPNFNNVSGSIPGGAPYVQGWDGFYNGYVYENTDASRRQFGPVAVVRANSASTSPSVWSSVVGTLLTSDITAPDGTTGAGRLSNGSSQGSALAVGVFTQSLSVGDIIIAGVWTRLNAGAAGNGWPGSAQLTGATASFVQPGFANNTTLPNGPITGEWFWSSTILKIATIANNPASLAFALISPANSTADFYAPVYYYIPAGTITDGEAMMFYKNLQAHNSNGVVGTLETMTGQVLVASASGIGNGSPGSISAPALGTGGGPTTPGTIVAWAQVNYGGTIYWAPLAQ